MVLIEKIDKKLIEDAKTKDNDYQKTALSPTDALSCPRKIFYRWHKYEGEPLDATSCRIFSLGDSIHIRWQEFLKDMGIQLKDEHYIDDDYKGVPIHGYVDSICIIDNKPYIVEFKSSKDWIYTYNFGKKKVKKDYLQEAKEEHIAQVNLYMHFTGIHQAIILYENKNTSDLKEFIINYDPELVLRILNDFVKVYEQINLNVLPEKITGAKKDKYPCAWCNFREICFKDYIKK